MSRRVFLAHAREDKEQVRKLYRDLKERGLDPWLDEEDLLPGQIWRSEIPKAIGEAGVFLACLSSRSVEKSGYVQSEFRLALNAFGERPPGTIYLIPARLDDCEIPNHEIPDRGVKLRDVQWVDLWQEGGFDRLVRGIEHALGVADQPVAPKDAPTTIIPPEPKGLKPLRVFRDIEEPWCPEMVVIPAGSFRMGSTEPERRWAVERGAKREWVDLEKPQHRVTIPKPFAVGRYPITRGQFAVFVEATGHDMTGGAWVWIGNEWKHSGEADWCSPGFEQTDDHPVVCVSWIDAKTYVAWLSEETGEAYRLLSEAEWEYACRAGTTTRYCWGDEPPTEEQANFGRNVRGTSEIGAYPASPWGLSDMHGNVREWCVDRWHDSYEGAPADGSAWLEGNNSGRVVRGGSWDGNPGSLRSADRYGLEPGGRFSVLGFRVARMLTS